MDPRPRRPVTLATVCLECRDAHQLAAFYSVLLGWSVTRTEPDWVLVRDPEGGTGLSFQADPSYLPPHWPTKPDQQQMQLHLDFWVTDLEASVAEAVRRGARLAEQQPQQGVRVLLDPAGHPFCLFAD